MSARDAPPTRPRAEPDRPPLPYPSPDCFSRLDEFERGRRLREAIDGIDDRRDAWVFAYGSLMWRPAFEPADSVKVTVADHQRRFCFWTCSSRGDRETPGLGLGIEPGPHGCVGIAQRLDPDRIDEQMRALWAREMGSGVYRARWIEVEAGDGRRLRALGFVADPEHPQFVEALEPEVAARVIARARGRFGRCRDYLAGVVAELNALAAPDPRLEALLAVVDRHAHAA